MIYKLLVYHWQGSSQGQTKPGDFLRSSSAHNPQLYCLRGKQIHPTTQLSKMRVLHKSSFYFLCILFMGKLLTFEKSLKQLTNFCRLLIEVDPSSLKYGYLLSRHNWAKRSRVWNHIRWSALMNIGIKQKERSREVCKGTSK